METNTAEKATHTPTPWEYDQKRGMIWSGSGGKLSWVADCLPETLPFGKTREPYDADAAFIVRCVNSHEALLRLLTIAAEDLERWYHENATPPVCEAFKRNWLTEAKRVIAQAEGR